MLAVQSVSGVGVRRSVAEPIAACVTPIMVWAQDVAVRQRPSRSP
jgi:hypothetical protein